MSRRSQKIKELISSKQIGVSFSVKTCREYGIDWQNCLQALLHIGVKRFRIMSYWDLHEQQRGSPDFSLLDQQIAFIRQAGAKASLCIGMRQPRWPETHMPDWTASLVKAEKEIAYMAYYQKVIEHYRKESTVVSWQLENEFWNRGFGINNDFSRTRLRREFDMLRAQDPGKPIVMSLANTFGYPIGKPRADIYGTTIYLSQFKNGSYSTFSYPSWYFKLRRQLLRVFVRRELIIHELQAEPWGPKANYEMSDREQARSMSSAKLENSLKYARKTGMTYMDLWGAEWWYWRWTQHKDEELWSMVRLIFVS